MKFYKVIRRESGAVIDTVYFDSEADDVIKSLERKDKKNKCFVPDSYDKVEVNNQSAETNLKSIEDLLLPTVAFELLTFIYKSSMYKELEIKNANEIERVYLRDNMTLKDKRLYSVLQKNNAKLYADRIKACEKYNHDFLKMYLEYGRTMNIEEFVNDTADLFVDLVKVLTKVMCQKVEGEGLISVAILEKVDEGGNIEIKGERFKLHLND